MAQDCHISTHLPDMLLHKPRDQGGGLTFYREGGEGGKRTVKRKEEQKKTNVYPDITN